MIELPWPPKELNPNARSHYLSKAKIAKAYREQVYWITKTAYTRGELMTSELPAEGKIDLRFDFHPPDKRARDLDNMLASVKAGMDGFADAIGVNDQRFRLWLSREDSTKGGKVIVSILPCSFDPPPIVVEGA